MKYLLYFTIILLATFVSYSASYKLVCYYDMTSPSKVGSAKFTSKDMELALRFCTHVIYSYVAIVPKKFILTAPDQIHELKNMQDFKKKYPNIKFLLSVSGSYQDKSTKSFLELLEDHYAKQTFTKAVMDVLNTYKFDGLSLDLPLPRDDPVPVYSYGTKIWHKFLNFFKGTNRDSKAKMYKAQLTSLIHKLSSNLKEHNSSMLVLNVLPNVNSKEYFDVAEIIKSLDFVILSAFDFYTPERNPKSADLMSPTKSLNHTEDTSGLTNIKNLYKYWHSQYVPRHKIIVGVAAFGRAWKMTKQSKSDGIPPVLNTDGPAAAGPRTHTPGFLSWPEICKKLSHDVKLTSVTDPKAKSGIYAYRPADSMGNFGIWISYENPITAAAKAEYVRNHNLGGVALFEISLDDVHGDCSGEKFPILRSIKFRLSRSEE